MTPFARVAPRLRIYASVVAASAALGLSYTAIIGADPAFGAVAGGSIGALLMGFELFFVQTHVGEPLRRLPLAGFICVSTAVWAVGIAASILIIAPAVLGVEAYPEELAVSTFGQDMIYSFGVAFLVNFVVRVRSLLGGRMLTNFLVGRYHRPHHEHQVFLFIDVFDSTGLTSRLGDLHAQSLLARFFFDIAGPIRFYRGETHRYVGDELVVTWPLERGLHDACCVRCVLAIRRHLAARAESYLRDFGEVPHFHVGLHGGAVVASEIGDDRRDIVYFGDTINTAARLRSLCKEVGRDLLVSAALLERMDLPPEVRAESLGEFSLAGKRDPLLVYALHEDGD